jgi:pimeloyl-ACP methyl ester carboxylesterase
VSLDLSSRPDPATSWEDAKRRVDALLATDAAEPLVPEGLSIALLAQALTPRAVVLFHGYTSAPRQFLLIAQAYRDAGCNVWVPRMPFHGYADRLTRDLSQITAPMLREHADRAVDIAAGLGDRVTVVGLSGGGSLATWCAVERPEVTETVAISPLMQPLGVPSWVTRALVGVLPHAPDKYDWWYPPLRDAMPGYGYPRFSYRGLGALLQLVYWTERVAERRPHPVTGRFTLVRNEGDERLDGAFNVRLVERLVPPDRLTIRTVPAAEGLIHDIVTPEATGENAARIDVAYRYLSEALGVGLPAPSSLFSEPERADGRSSDDKGSGGSGPRA